MGPAMKFNAKRSFQSCTSRSVRTVKQSQMSFEEEDNSPFGEGSVRRDDFTDLPLEDENDSPHDEPQPQTSTGISDPPTTEPISAEPAATASDTVSHTTAYNPELYTSTIQHSFEDKSAVTIKIVDAGKSHEGQSRGYIAYTIQTNDSIVRRRYSEFESLRKSLVRLFPTLIIPPIPEKHKLAKYATAPTKAKEDSDIIKHRQRMLGVFLNRCLAIDQVRESSVYQQFLDPNANWSEVLVSPPLSNIPKNILQADPIDPSNSSAAHSYLPVPSTSTLQGKSTPDDVKFNFVETKAREYEEIISSGVERVNKRLVKHLADLGLEDSEAGSVFNAFSLQESGDLAQVLEKIGQAHDNNFATTEILVRTLNDEFSEPAGESAQYAFVVKDVLKFRQQKSLQLDITARSLKHKVAQLKLLEKSVQESKRIERALEAGQSKTGQINFDRKVAAAKQKEVEQSQDINDLIKNTDEVTPLSPKKQPAFKIPGLSKISNFIKQNTESAPETLQQQNIIKAKEDINQLKQTFTAADSDLKKVTASLYEELAKFKELREEEQKKMILAYSRCILDWSRKNLEFWEDTKEHIGGV